MLELGQILCEVDMGMQQADEKERERIVHLDAALQRILKPTKKTRAIFSFTTQGQPNPLQVRLISVLAYRALCTDHPMVSLASAARAAALDENPASVVEVRRTAWSLCERGVVRYSNGKHPLNGELQIAQLDTLKFIIGDKANPALFTEQAVDIARERKARKAQDRAQRRVVGKQSEVGLPDISPKELVEQIRQVVIGNELESTIRRFATRICLHVQRARMLQQDMAESMANECILLIGESGCGKTFLAETAARFSLLPVSISCSSSLTEDGWCGENIDSILKGLIQNAGNPARSAAWWPVRN